MKYKVTDKFLENGKVLVNGEEYEVSEVIVLSKGVAVPFLAEGRIEEFDGAEEKGMENPYPKSTKAKMIDLVGVDYGREDMNALAAKVNEIIEHINAHH